LTVVLKIEDIGKKYLINHKKNENYSTLRDLMASKALSFLNRLRFGKNKAKDMEDGLIEEFWANKNINLEISRGDKVGIIGRNGAGKSTLLKILSRITEPSTGKITINGTIASLLEVGTGFHPELTGRENIYLNGAIMGMSRKDIDKSFNEIVSFSEVEQFLDTPVKRYSSGMYVRLAFAVAAHIDTDILIVDEVLAVGDAKFQKKSLKKMNDISESGKTLLFVSHNMGAISQLCNKIVVLNNGEVSFVGDVQKGIEHYLGFSKNKEKFDISKYKTDKLIIKEVLLSHEDNREDNLFDIDENILIHVTYEVLEKIEAVRMDIILSRFGTDIFYSFITDDLEEDYLDLEVGVSSFCYKINKKFLKAGQYSAKISFGTSSEVLIYIKDINFDVEEITLNTHNKGYKQERSGCVIGQGEWLSDF
tara:strand:+ start:2909 stop:4171 length:1263 start_codon:yes stop_codon:yes gene_type:complete